MLRKFGSDLTSLINSDPSWKISKGNRSSSRRARKAVAKSLNNCVSQGCRSSKDSKMPVSESQKHEVAALGCRFGEKAEHVPIKKRRFLFRSPSPPPAITSPLPEEIVALTKIDEISNQDAVSKSATSEIILSPNDNNSICAQNSVKSDGKFSEDEDFSGISILAAAACSSSLGREYGYAEHGTAVEDSTVLQKPCEVSTSIKAVSLSKELLKEDLLSSSEMSTGGTLSCISTEPVGALGSISTAVNLPSEVVADKNYIKDVSMEAGSLTSSGKASCRKGEETVGSQRPSSRDTRFHWDLNVVMDAWEEPLDDTGVHNFPHTQDAVKNNHDSLYKRVTACVDHCSLIPGEQKPSTNQTSGGRKGNHDRSVCHNIDQHVCLGEKSVVSSTKSNLNVVKCVIDETKSRNSQTVYSTDKLVATASDHATKPSSSGGLNEAHNAAVKTNFNGERGHHDPHDLIDDFNSRVVGSSFEVETLSTVSASDHPAGTISDETHVSSHMSSMSRTLRDVTQNVAHSKDAQGSVSDGKILPHSSMCTEVSNSTSTTCELQMALVTKVQEVSNIWNGNIVHNNATATGFSEIHPMVPKDSRDSHFGETSKANLIKCLKYSEKDDNDERAEYYDDGSVRRDTVAMAGVDVSGGVQADYDSQYEDGELRESTELAWEEYDDVDREHEHVDYGSDNTGTYIAYPSDYHDSESGQVEGSKNGRQAVVPSGDYCFDNEVCKQAVAAEDDKGNDNDNKRKLCLSAVEKMEVLGETEQRENSKSFSDLATGVIDDNGRKDRLPTHVDVLVDPKGTETRDEPKVFRRSLQSRIEGPISRDGTSIDDRPFRTENRYEPGSTRYFERGRYSYHNRGRGRQGGNWDGLSDYRRGYKRHYSPINYRRSKPDDDDAVMERDDIRCDGNRNGASYSNQLPNTRIGADEEPCAGLQSRYRPNTKFSPDRSADFGRGRPFRYGSFVESRAGRGRYNGPSSDESFQSLKYRRPLSRRERSFSPFGGRGQSHINHSRGKSPSQSRSRSPIVWDSPRERPEAGRGCQTFIRHRSRSPNFRSEVRIQRLRSSNQQQGFGDGHAAGFKSITRTHSSPPRNRWNSGRRDEMGHFREFGYKQRTTPLERSPGRFRSRGDGDGVIGSPQNLKPDGYSRFSDRISEDGVGRGLRYADNYEERRKPHNFLRPARRSFEDGMASRLHHDMDDGFSNTTNIRNRDAPRFRGRGGFRGIDSHIGDMRRKFRGEQLSSVYERDGKFNSNSKEFSVDVNDSTHNQKSEDHFHPNHTGRYDDMSGSGTNQGHRYDNYEDRRKQYSTSNFMRHTDNLGPKERLNHNADENFQDASDFCGGSTRGFEGQAGTVSTRLKEDLDAAVCEQEEKPENNSQSAGVQNPENDASAGFVPS